MSTPVSTQVDTAQGTVRGTTTPTGLRAFRAIPYAAPPVGNLRFRAPRPPAPWTGVRNAMHHGPVAPQRVSQAFSAAGPDTDQSEDCLTLNVLAPAESSDTLRPVIVWFHGGAFSQGSASAPAYAGDSATLHTVPDTGHVELVAPETKAWVATRRLILAALKR